MACPREHYDGVGSRRGRGARGALHVFHNDAKRALLAQFATGAPRLLDLACGRGGDIHKWRALGVGQVTALDVSEHSLAEARARAAAAKARGAAAAMRFELADVREFRDGAAQYDVVTCMFALHYLFETEQAAWNVVRTAAANLRPGGHFVGIVPDGLRVNECIRHGPFDNGVMRICPKWAGAPQAFGSGYTCSIDGTVVQDCEALEFLVYDTVLCEICRRCGLVPVPVRGPQFDPPPAAGTSAAGTSAAAAFHHLRPPYPAPLADCSRVFAAFAFIKAHV